MSFDKVVVLLLTLLPGERSFDACHLAGPNFFGSFVGHVKGSSGKQYVYRFERKGNPDIFSWDLVVSQIASRLNIAPSILAYDHSERCMVLEYIERKLWPSYKEDPRPYHACMDLLRQFHELGTSEIKPCIDTCPHQAYFPYSTIQTITDMLKQGAIPVPRHFFQMSGLITTIFKTVQPLIDQDALIGHHDFSINNCLLSKDRVYIIDWTTAAPYADRYHDIASFVSIFDTEERLALLKAYLKKDEVSSQDYARFRLSELVSLARVAAICFYDQRKTQLPDEREKAQIVRTMEEMLDSKSLSGRSYLSVEYALDAAQLRMRALLALQEFIDAQDELSMLLKVVKI